MVPALTAHEGRGNALPGLDSCPGVGISGDLHAQVTAQDGCSGSQQEGDHGEQTVLHLIGAGALARRGHRAQQSEDQDGHDHLRQHIWVSDGPCGPCEQRSSWAGAVPYHEDAHVLVLREKETVCSF